MKFIILIFLLVTNIFAVDFSPIRVTENEAFNYFFSFPIYTMFISLPFVAVLALFKKI